jgi:hypothetical protein
MITSLVVLILMILVSGCTPRPVATKADIFPRMYEEQPRSILILPPMNESTDAEAKSYYMTTIEMPFALMGYYIFPVEMVSDIMKQEGVYDTELLYHLPLDKFYEYFGADAVLYTRIKKWDVAYAVIASSLTIVIEAEIVSTKTSQQLWKYTGSVHIDLGGGNNAGGLAGLLVSAIATAVNTAAVDYVDYAHVANARLIRTLPVGPYHPNYLKDQAMPLQKQR